MTSGRFKVGRRAEVAINAFVTNALARYVIPTFLSVATTLAAATRDIISDALSRTGLGGLGRRVR